MKWILVLVLGIILVSGCVRHEIDNQVIIVEKCRGLCRASNLDLSDGPCLSDDNPDWGVEDWVCDVAHSPREAVDNQPENQCQAFRMGEAHHFVEVDPNCEFIKAV